MHYVDVDTELSRTPSRCTVCRLYQRQSSDPLSPFVFLSAGAWSFSVSELAAPGVEVGRLTASDPDLGENAQLEFTILDAEEAEIFNITGRDHEAVIVLDKVSEDETQVQSFYV